MAIKESNLTTITSPASGDKIRIIDDPSGTPLSRNITIENLLKIINSLTEDTAPSGSADFLLEYDTSTAAAKKVKPDTLLALVNGLTEDTNPDEANDYILTYDASANAAKKVKPNNIAIGGSTIVYKLADESINSTTTLQDDNVLAFAVSANKAYFVNVYLLVQAAASASTMDFKCGWTYPASTTIDWGANSALDTSTESWGAGTLTGGFSDLLKETESRSIGLSANSPDKQGIHLMAIVQVAGTAGSLQFQWAQNTSNANNLTVKAGSFLEYRLLN